MQAFRQGPNQQQSHHDMKLLYLLAICGSLLLLGLYMSFHQSDSYNTEVSVLDKTKIKIRSKIEKDVLSPQQVDELITHGFQGIGRANINLLFTMNQIHAEANNTKNFAEHFGGLKGYTSKYFQLQQELSKYKQQQQDMKEHARDCQESNDQELHNLKTKKEALQILKDLLIKENQINSNTDNQVQQEDEYWIKTEIKLLNSQINKKQNELRNNKEDYDQQEMTLKDKQSEKLTNEKKLNRMMKIQKDYDTDTKQFNETESQLKELNKQYQECYNNNEEYIKDQELAKISLKLAYQLINPKIILMKEERISFIQTIQRLQSDKSQYQNLQMDVTQIDIKLVQEEQKLQDVSIELSKLLQEAGYLMSLNGDQINLEFEPFEKLNNMDTQEFKEHLNQHWQERKSEKEKLKDMEDFLENSGQDFRQGLKQNITSCQIIQDKINETQDQQNSLKYKLKSIQLHSQEEIEKVKKSITDLEIMITNTKLQLEGLQGHHPQIIDDIERMKQKLQDLLKKEVKQSIQYKTQFNLGSNKALTDTSQKVDLDLVKKQIGEMQAEIIELEKKHEINYNACFKFQAEMKALEQLGDELAARLVLNIQNIYHQRKKLNEDLSQMIPEDSG